VCSEQGTELLLCKGGYCVVVWQLGC